MNTASTNQAPLGWLPVLAAAGLLWCAPSWAQVPVDEDGRPLEAEVMDEADVAEAAAETNLTADELEALVGPIALYPDDLLAIVLPASAYPLQIVQAARFLEEVERDESLEPDEAWDESVTALLNYPEIVEMMNDDLDWTYELGEAVVRQQADVIAAIESFRDRAYAAGNLKSDERQTVSRDNGVIQIEPVEEEIIYVPYYEPERVVVYQPQPVYYYYPRPYPVYYYPYPYGYSFASGYFWGVTTAFRIGWVTDHLHVFHHSYFGHPYYGHHYFGHWYRRPSIRVHNTFYVNNHVRRPSHHERDGDFWRPRRHSGALLDRNRYREAYYSDRRRERSEDGYRNDRTRQIATDRAGLRGDRARAGRAARADGGDIATRFGRARANREGRGARSDERSAGTAAERRRQATSGSGSGADDAIRFRPRERAATRGAPGNDQAIRFRARERAATRAPARANDAPAQRNPDTSRRTVTRPSSERAIRAPSVRERTISRGSDSTPQRRAAPAPRAVERAPAARPRASTPRAAPQPRVSRRATTSRPRAPAARPRASAPRAAPTPRVSRPATASPRAPSSATRAAPRRPAAAPSRSGSKRAHQR
jgi:hypothetical protein